MPKVMSHAMSHYISAEAGIGLIASEGLTLGAVLQATGRWCCLVDESQRILWGTCDRPPTGLTRKSEIAC